MRLNRLLTVVAVAWISTICSGQASLPEIFRDPMVLQRNMPIPVWGKATAGAAISVMLSEAKASTTAAADGSWRVELPARKEGGPYVLDVTADGKTTTITSTNPYGFEIAGADNVFHPAMSSVEGDTVALSSPLVKDEKNVRYGWREYPQLSLYNLAGLPASPFSTLPQ